MKNTIKLLALLSFALIAFTSSAQDNQYITNVVKTDSVGVDAIVKEIVSSTGKPYQFNYKNFKNGTLVYAYNDPTKDNEGVIISFYQSAKGENKDLGIAGVKQYSLKSVYGKFLDLYPFWKAHFNDKLTPEQITTNGTGDVLQVNSSKKIRFRKYQDLIWSIDL